MDFTFNIYRQLLDSLLESGFAFQSYSQLSGQQSQKLIMLRHDVEERYENALRFAEIQNELGIAGSYYFRIMNGTFNRPVIEKIAALGHEIGYHYDDLSYCKGDHKAAIQRFEKHLNLLREIAPVQTITMEGAPLSKYDNKDLWKHYNYRDYGIIAEPYFDLHFGTEFNHSQPQTPNPKLSEAACPDPSGKSRERSDSGQQTLALSAVEVTHNKQRTPNNFFYLTDTGRRWDGWRVSVRDKVPQQEEWIRQGLVFRTTNDIIKAANAGHLPARIMMTFHPQRWNDRPLPWLKELLWQSVKNVGKRILIQIKKG